MFSNALIRRVIKTAALCAISCHMRQCLTPTCERETERENHRGGVLLTGRHREKKASEQIYRERGGRFLLHISRSLDPAEQRKDMVSLSLSLPSLAHIPAGIVRPRQCCNKRWTYALSLVSLSLIFDHSISSSVFFVGAGVYAISTNTVCLVFSGGVVYRGQNQFQITQALNNGQPRPQGEKMINDDSIHDRS